METFYLTTAIDYVNSRPHLGTAYEKVTADVIARFKRLAGYDTHFVMGNDEHSLNVFKKAGELGIEPLAYCDKMEKEFKYVKVIYSPLPSYKFIDGCCNIYVIYPNMSSNSISCFDYRMS